MVFDWDPDKNAENLRKHGFSLEEAEAVFQDQARLEEFDDRDYGEERWTTMMRSRYLLKDWLGCSECPIPGESEKA